MRKIIPELTSVPIFLYFVCEMLPQYGMMSGLHPGLETANPRPPKQTTLELNHYSTGPPPPLLFLILKVQIVLSYGPNKKFSNSYIYPLPFYIEDKKQIFFNKKSQAPEPHSSCDLRQVTSLFYALESSSVKWAIITVPTHKGCLED